MNVLAERMKALKAKEASENAAVVDAAIERDQAIVAGIRGDAAERRTPERASDFTSPSLPARSRGRDASARCPTRDTHRRWNRAPRTLS